MIHVLQVYLISATHCATYAQWYFMGNTSDMLTSPTVRLLFRNCTKFFGSICFGSLLILVIKPFRLLFRLCYGNTFDGCFGHTILQSFSTYTFNAVSVYGVGFMEAGHHVHTLIHTRSVDALVTKTFVGAFIVVTGLNAGAISQLLVIFFSRGDECNSISSATEVVLLGLVTLCTIWIVCDVYVNIIIVTSTQQHSISNVYMLG